MDCYNLPLNKVNKFIYINGHILSREYWQIERKTAKISTKENKKTILNFSFCVKYQFSFASYVVFLHNCSLLKGDGVVEFVSVHMFNLSNNVLT